VTGAESTPSAGEIVKTYRVERATLSRADYAKGLVPAWAVLCKDGGGSHVVAECDTRALARDAARRLRGAAR
jgi:hypothetical protein